MAPNPVLSEPSYTHPPTPLSVSTAAASVLFSPSPTRRQVVPQASSTDGSEGNLL